MKKSHKCHQVALIRRPVKIFGVHQPGFSHFLGIGGAYKDGSENIFYKTGRARKHFFTKSGRARRFWTDLIGRAR